MLCLSRKPGEQILIPTPIGPIWITVLEIGDRFGPNKVKLGLQAPAEAVILRGELFDPNSTPEVCQSPWGKMPVRA